MNYNCYICAMFLTNMCGKLYISYSDKIHYPGQGIIVAIYMYGAIDVFNITMIFPVRLQGDSLSLEEVGNMSLDDATNC